MIKMKNRKGMDRKVEKLKQWKWREKFWGIEDLLGWGKEMTEIKKVENGIFKRGRIRKKNKHEKRKVKEWKTYWDDEWEWYK